VIRPSRNPLLYCLFAMMFVIVRMADAHAHLCFDGKEPPASVHVADGEAHPCESRDGTGHTGDKDVRLTTDVLLKKASADDVWLSSSVRFEVWFVAQTLGEPLRAVAPIGAASTRYFFRPPLRGPPV
jgi:hypothetical protein